MPGEIVKDTHTDNAQFEGPVKVGDPHAKRPLDKKQGQEEADKSVSNKDSGTVFPSGKVAEQFQQMFSEEGLSEAFTSKASVLIEGAISEHVSVLREQLEEEYATKLEEATAFIEQSLTEKIDTYINYVAETYVADNKLAIEAGIKSEIAEQVMSSVTAIIESAGVTLPEEKVDVAEALTQEVLELETKLNEAVQKEIGLVEQVKKYQIAEAFDTVSEGLSVAGKEKLKRLTENLSFDTVDQYKEKVSILKESVETKPSTAPAADLNEQLTLPKTEVKATSSIMDKYIAASKLV